ncbi:alpha/beta hydrolase-fold protein [Gordonia sp. NPDC003376]
MTLPSETTAPVALRSRSARRRRRSVAAAVVAAAIGLGSGIGPAFAVDPTVERTSASCYFTSDTDRAQNVQTCYVWSESMQTTVTVKVRPSDQQAGQPEQAVYFLGQLSDPIANGRGDLYDTGYTLVSIPDSATTWSANWESTPVDNSGNPLSNYEGTGDFDPQWETFVGEELPTFLNQNFDVGTTGNAISGLSISGGQAINLALKYPEVFSVAVSRSGYYHTDNIFGYFAVPFILATRQGVGNGFDGLWGNPLLPGNSWAANDVATQIIQAKATGQTIIVSTGNGLPASQAEWDEMMAQGGILHVAIGVGLEMISFASTVLLNIQAEIFDLPVQFIYTDGAHTWNRWIRTDAEEVDKLEDALKGYVTTTSTTSVARVNAVTESTTATTQTPVAEPTTVDSIEAETTDVETPEAQTTEAQTTGAQTTGAEATEAETPTAGAAPAAGDDSPAAEPGSAHTDATETPVVDDTSTQEADDTDPTGMSDTE